MDTTLLESPEVTDLYKPGREARARILAEMASRWESHLPDLSLRELAEVLGEDRGWVNYHLASMREDGLIHDGKTAITRAGYEAARR